MLRVGSEAVAEFQERHEPPRTSFFARLALPLFLYDVLIFPGGQHHRVAELPLGMKIDVLSEAVMTPMTPLRGEK